MKIVIIVLVPVYVFYINHIKCVKILFLECISISNIYSIEIICVVVWYATVHF